MNIGFFTDTYTPQVDGVVTAINLYRRELEKRGHQVYIFAPHGLEQENDFFKREEEDDPRVFRFKSLDSIFIPGYPFAVPISFRASHKIPKLKLDIVHAHTYASLGMLADLVALLINAPKIFTYHTYYSEYAKDYIFSGKIDASRLVKKYDVFYCNRSDRVITPSIKLKNILEDFGVKSQIDVLPTGVDASEFSGLDGKQFRIDYNLRSDQPMLLFVGRLGKEKNVDFLLRMMNVLVRQDSAAVLFIVGDGKYRKELEALARELNLEKNVVFTGYLKRSETLAAFAAADVFTFSSLTDTQGLVLLEAASFGKPIVMVKDEGIGEVVVDGKNGFITEENPRVFCEKVLSLLQKKELYGRMSSNSKAIAADFTIVRQTDKLLKIYDDSIREHSDSSRRAKFWLALRKDLKIPEWLKINKKVIANFNKDKNDGK